MAYCTNKEGEKAMEIKSYKKKNGDTAYGFRVYVGKENGKDRYVKRQGFPKSEGTGSCLATSRRFGKWGANKKISQLKR